MLDALHFIKKTKILKKFYYFEFQTFLKRTQRVRNGNKNENYSV